MILTEFGVITGLFENNTAVYDIKDLSFLNIGGNSMPADINGKCYKLFKNCSNITELPNEFSTYTLNQLSNSDGCFNETFASCSGLTQIKINLSMSSYYEQYRMFKDCTSLTTVSRIFK